MKATKIAPVKACEPAPAMKAYEPTRAMKASAAMKAPTATVTASAARSPKPPVSDSIGRRNE